MGGSGGPDTGRYFSSYLCASVGSVVGTASRSTGANNENLSITNCGQMGSIPVVNQFLTEESGSCLSNTNHVEYLYGGLEMITGSHSYNPSRQEAHE